VSPTPASSAERLLDLLAEDLLWSVLWTGDGGQAQSELATMIPALGSAGVIEPGSPAFARLITLARQLDIDLPHGSPTVSPADLPQAWTGALGARDRRDGHDGLTPAAAVLPETDGALFAITGLHSTGQAVILHTLAWGWVPARTRFPRTGQRYSWTALYDAGRWHIARQIGRPHRRNGRPRAHRHRAHLTAAPSGHVPRHHPHRPHHPSQRHRAAALAALR
jgi:hypothetical protein